MRLMRGMMERVRCGVLSMGVVAVWAVGTPTMAQVTSSTFTYQGRLEQGGEAYSGPATVRIGVYSSESATGPLAQSVPVDVEVVDGLFVFDADLGTTAFEVPGRFYQIDVQTPGQPGFVGLDRVGVRSAPVAGLAHRASTLYRMNTGAGVARTVLVSQSLGDSVTISNNFWQQFTPDISATAMRLVVQTRTDSNGAEATLRMYRGASPQGGLLLSSQRVFVPPHGEAVLELIPARSIVNTSGATYCWELSTNSPIGLVHAAFDALPNNNSSLGANDFVFRIVTGSDPVMALGARRFGVNEGDPLTALHVADDDFTVGRFSSTSLAGTAVQLESRASNILYNLRVFDAGSGDAGSTGHFGIERVGGTSFMRLTSAGLSVNTISSSAALNVAAAASLQTAVSVSSPSTTGTRLTLANSSTDGLAWNITSTGQANSFGPGNLVIGNPAPGLVISPTGRVGIGAAPLAMLQVEGGGNLSQNQIGFIQAGSALATNLSLDTNEVQVLNNGSPASLFLNFRGGQVFVGDTANPIAGNAMQVNGNALKPGGGLWGGLSDARAKKDIQPLQGTLDRVLSLHGYTFEYTDDAIAQGGALRGMQVGLLAQEVQRVFPEWVYEDDKGRLNVSERGITALMVESLRDLREEKDAGDAELREALASENARLQDQVDAAMARVREVEAQNRELRERLERIERMIAAP